METNLRVIARKSVLGAASFATFFFAGNLFAQAPAPRITEEIDNAQRAIVPGTHPPMARAEFDAGRLPSATPLSGMSIVFKRSAAQEAELQALIVAQQDPKSSQYHAWLTPEQFAARFGVGEADLAKVEFWLEQQGLTVEGRSRAKNRVRFSGAAAQVESAFGTEMHYYTLNGTRYFAPSTDLSVPAAVSSLVESVSNLSTFRPKPHVKYRSPQIALRPDFTSSQSGDHFLSPKDIATIYDITPAYNAGFNGSGQALAVVGQSSIVVSDIENFQHAAGLAKKDPTQILVPSSGTAVVSSGDESESDLDLEYSGAIAPGATIYFVYVGNNTNFSVFDALTYAIDSRTASVITISYGSCESDLGSGEYSSLNGTLAQAAAQGQTIVTADGDDGSTDCYGNKGQSIAAQEALAVDFPSSSQYVTGMGGTEFPAADVVSTNTTYWESANGTDIIGSAKSYIPEQVWNDDSSSGGLSAGGGGASTLTARPSWQTGVPGIPTGNFRLVPDIAFTASPNNAGFLYCSSDSQDTGITGSCANGFRDSNNTYLTIAGGTSFDAPIFAGMVAIINQKLNSSGQGVVNPTLYALASNPATYASAFHDITSGNNACTAGTTYCGTAALTSFSATTGYDEASGLGSLDFYNLLTAWSGSSTSSGKSFTLAATAATVSAGSSTTSTITATPEDGYTGTIAFTVSSNPAVANLCFSLPSLAVSGTSAASTTLTISTSSAGCANVAQVGVSGANHRAGGFSSSALQMEDATLLGSRSRLESSVAGRPFAAAMAAFGLVFVGLLGFASRKLGAIAALVLLTVVSWGMSGCSSANSSATSTTTPTSSNAQKGTYAITITGADTTDSSIKASTSMTLTID
jgi:subtilase family serine protease